jgi:hypothetical protein
MTRTIVTSVVFIFLLSCSVKVETGDAEKLKIDKTCDAIMQAFKDENVDAAMGLLKKNSIIGNDAVDTLHATIIKQGPWFSRWGKPISYMLGEEKKIGDFFAKRYYVLRYEQYFNVFILSVYKTNGGWRITQITYNDDLIDHIL